MEADDEAYLYSMIIINKLLLPNFIRNLIAYSLTH